MRGLDAGTVTIMVGYDYYERGTHTSWPVAMFQVFRNRSTAGLAVGFTFANATVPMVFM